MSLLDWTDSLDRAGDWLDECDRLYSHAFDHADTMLDDVADLNEATMRYVLRLYRESGQMTIETMQTLLGSLSSSDD
jgi:hypothetical protein